MVKTRASKGFQENQASPDSRADARPIRPLETGAVSERIKEIIGVESVSSFSRRCGISEAVLRSYINDGRAPSIDKGAAIAIAGNVTVDWLATGRLPKTRAELRAATQQSQSQGNSVAGGAQQLDTYRLAVEVVQEWQLENGRCLPLEKFARAIDLLVDLSGGEPEQVRKHSAKVLYLAA